METEYMTPLCVPSEKFKSYYVVWKPSTVSLMKCVFTSLNRTMQYGNKRVETSTQVGSEFKSYYVVWKHISSARFSIS